MKTKFEDLKEDIEDLIKEKTKEQETNVNDTKEIMRILGLLQKSQFPIFDVLNIESVEIDAKNSPIEVVFESSPNYEDDLEFMWKLTIDGDEILLTDNNDYFRFEENKEIRKIIYKYDNDIICVTCNKEVKDDADDAEILRKYIKEHGGYGSINIGLYRDAWASTKINNDFKTEDEEYNGYYLDELEKDFEIETKAIVSSNSDYSWYETAFLRYYCCNRGTNSNLESDLDCCLNYGILYRNYIHESKLAIYKPVTKKYEKIK